jgi:hypothetical protein
MQNVIQVLVISCLLAVRTTMMPDGLRSNTVEYNNNNASWARKRVRAYEWGRFAANDVDERRAVWLADGVKSPRIPDSRAETG